MDATTSVTLITSLVTDFGGAIYSILGAVMPLVIGITAFYFGLRWIRGAVS